MDAKGTGERKRVVSRRDIYLPVGVLIVTGLFIAFRPMGVIDTWSLSRTLARIEGENRILRAEVAKLKQDAIELTSNEKTIESEARKMGLVRPGEIIVFTDNGGFIFNKWRNTATSHPR